MISDSVRVIGPRGARWTGTGVRGAGGLLEFSGFMVSRRLMVGRLPVSVWTGSDFGVCSPIRSTGSGGCVVGGLMVGAGPAGGLLEFSGFWCGGWLVSACWLALVWTGSVFGSRSRVWSVVWVLRADRRAVFDCCVIGWPLEFRGFGVVSGWWLFAGRCRCGPDRFSVLVLWFGPWFGCFGRMA